MFRDVQLFVSFFVPFCCSEGHSEAEVGFRVVGVQLERFAKLRHCFIVSLTEMKDATDTSADAWRKWIQFLRSFHFDECFRESTHQRKEQSVPFVCSGIAR